FFIKQKTAYDIFTRLEFRHVLFRSIGEITTCPLNTGRWSRKAINRSVRATTLAGSSPRLILQMTSSLTRPILGAGSAGGLEPCRSEERRGGGAVRVQRVGGPQTRES